MSAEKKPEAKENFFREMLTSPRTAWRTIRNLAAEFWNDHEFWIHTLAVKGGASAIAIAGVMAVSHVVALPFLLAAGGIALCGAAIGLGVFVVVAGAAEAWGKMREIYARARGIDLPAASSDAQPSFSQRLKETPFVQKLMQKPAVQKILASRAWKLSRKFAQKEQDMILGGFAVGGSFVNVAVGITLLVTQIAVLPVIALGSLVTVASAAAIGTLAAGGAGLYISLRSLFERHHARQQEKAQAVPETLPEKLSEKAPVPTLAGNGDLTQKFQDVQKSEEIPASAAQGKKAPEPDGKPPSGP